MDLKSFLESYKINLEYFDINTFEDEIMDIPYQIKVLKENLDKMNENEKKEFIYLNNLLKEKLKKAKPKNELQKRIVFELKKVI
jgi:aconitase A